jgi:hypothetical protein
MADLIYPFSGAACFLVTLWLVWYHNRLASG